MSRAAKMRAVDIECRVRAMGFYAALTECLYARKPDGAPERCRQAIEYFTLCGAIARHEAAK